MAEKKAKFTVIDAVIILIVLAAVGFGAMKLVSALTDSTNGKAEFLVELTMKEQELADAMKVGDKVTMSLTEKDGGVIKNIETKPAEQMVFDSIKGEYRNETVEGKIDIYVTVEADVEISDIAVKMGDTSIQVGTNIPVRGKGYASSGYILETNIE